MTNAEEVKMLREFLDISEKYRVFASRLEAQYGCLLQAMPGGSVYNTISIASIRYKTAMLDDAVRKAIFELNKEVK